MAWLNYLHNYMQQQELADLWDALGERFMRFAGEEQGRTEPTTKGEVLRRMDQVLRASGTYRKHPEGWERGKPEQGLICLLDTPPHGVWNYCSDGISENFFERVRLCAAQAGRALPDCPKNADPEDFWLHSLYLNLLENNSDSLFSASKDGGMIVSVCVASATFCARLRRYALVHAENDAKSSIIVSVEETGNLDEAGAATLRQEVRAARLSLALGKPVTTGTKQADPSRPQNSGKTAQSADRKPSDAAGNMPRKAVLIPLLCKKNFSVHDWANEAGVDWHTAADYLKGKSKPYQSTLGKLARALDIQVEDMPS